MRALLTVLLMAAGLPALADAPPDSAALRAAIEKAIGPAHCQADADCASLAVGRRPCGGPELYLPYAPAAVKDPAQLQALLRQHAAQRRSEQAGRVGHCALAIDPGARCAAGRCVAGGGATPAGLD